jgi:asparagine synthase (glutamine-hydrolysing)
MCGISGIFRFYGAPVYEKEIIKINNRQQHRGKDAFRCILGSSATAFSSYPGIALGHRRLSIIDLDEEAAQPMAYQENRYWITYNGELFNYLILKRELVSLGYVFKTNSDTEVILASFAEWGVDCLMRFDGMFAFAIWDEKLKQLFCARDPIGIKPFYYCINNNEFCFASESQALTNGETSNINPDALYSFIFSMYVPRQFSIFENIKKMLPGTYFIIDIKGNLIEKKYWTVCKGNNVKAEVHESAKELLSLLDRSVSSQLVSDVPVGAFLSGGFDSGMIVASAALSGVPIHTYSAGYDDGKQYNELPIAKSLANKYGTTHHERIITSNEIINILDKALSSMSEPVADSAIVPTYCLAEMAGSDGVKVLLSGTGGDEVLGGYSRYIGYNFARYTWLKTPFALKTFLGKAIIKNALLSKRLQSPELDMMMLSGGCANLAKSIFKDKRSFSIFLQDVLISTFPERKEDIPLLYANMHFDLQVYVPDLLLYTLDQLTMASTVEGRVPLLNTNFIRESYNLHPSMHVTATKTRLLMREMAKQRIDPRTLIMKKQGFSGPVKHWINSNEKLFKERVMAVREIPFLEDLKVDHYWQQSNKDTPVLRAEIFMLFCLSTWYQNRKNGR